jgi:hypothetical protein
MRRVPPARRAELAAVFLGPEERKRLGAYDAWLGYPSERVPSSVSGMAWGATVAIRQRGDEALPPRAEDVLAAIHRLRIYEGEFRRFREQLRKQWGPSAEAEVWNRSEVAELRAVGPLVAGAWTGGVERSAWELHEAGELGPYLRAALGAQLVLLRRSHAHRRIRYPVPMPTHRNPLGE